jgi:hypothetical protein
VLRAQSRIGNPTPAASAKYGGARAEQRCFVNRPDRLEFTTFSRPLIQQLKRSVESR